MTYSIVARDPSTGEMGVAVQSHWFSVGSVVVEASAGVGAIATQANPDLNHKPRALELLRGGMTASEVVAALKVGDSAVEHRQFAIVDPSGSAVAFTGADCIPDAGAHSGDGYSCQANMMRNTTVWDRMAAAFEAASGTLTMRLLAALDGAQAAGGDLRGQQSAAILVVPSSGTDADRVIDLRVEDHPDPLGELRRLVGVHDAYEFAERGDSLVAHGDFARAAHEYVEANRLAPDNDELQFWAGLGLIAAGETDRGRDFLVKVIATNSDWRVLLDRLDPEGVPASVEARRLLSS
ncbi:MAG TPA: DUF1028 domain-containing protein [Galbitalea sp.]|nr:DUF1028 domain-containing protein [Galbitalea sp.]